MHCLWRCLTKNFLFNLRTAPSHVVMAKQGLCHNSASQWQMVPLFISHKGAKIVSPSSYWLSANADKSGSFLQVWRRPCFDTDHVLPSRTWQAGILACIMQRAFWRACARKRLASISNTCCNKKKKRQSIASPWSCHFMFFFRILSCNNYESIPTCPMHHSSSANPQMIPPTLQNKPHEGNSP